MRLESVPRVRNITYETFLKEFKQPGKPVIIEDFSKSWPAEGRWGQEYMTQHYGDVPIDIYTEDFAKPGQRYMHANEIMPLANYLEEIAHGNSNKRMFLLNVKKHMPLLLQGIVPKAFDPDMTPAFIFMFCGGRGSVTQMHYDIDFSHVYHTVLHGNKVFYLFPLEQQTNIYRHPFTVRSNVNVEDPDYERYPALKNAEGYRVPLTAGDTLFIPAGCFHHVVYPDVSYAISLRSHHHSKLKQLHGLMNLVVMQGIDRILNKITPQAWYQYKEKYAMKRAER